MRLGDSLMQERHLLGIMFQLCLVAGFEFGPSCRVVSEPLSQIVGGCDLFEPQVDAGLFFGEAARPEPVDENASAVVFRGVVVDSFDSDGQGCFPAQVKSGAVAAVLHGGQLLVARPGDCEEKDRVAFGFYVVPDGGAKGEESAGGEIVRLAVDRDADLTLNDVEREGAVGVMLFHAGGVLHGDEDNPQVVFLKRVFAE